MAPNATIFKAVLHLADVDRHYYEDHTITLARHPSETDERMMVRLLAFARHAHEALSFGRGLSAEEEPALWQKDLTGLIELWIEVGLPDDRAVRQACGRAKQVCVYTYGGRAADQWWKQQEAALDRLNNLTVLNLSPEGSRALAGLAQRQMDLHCTIQDGQVLIGDGTHAAQIELTTWKAAATDR
ncbi:MAG: YaeQ family protein [Nitrospira sp.]|nr:YaeQ family protein [Nitrospira sp.]MCW5788190.1 YaeQ family protein [Nitrospira sp.]